MNRQPLRLAVNEAERILARAGVASPRADVELLAAHVLGVERGRLPLVPLVDPAVVEALRALVERRARREPLQHITGTAALGGVTVDVGPGVFVPRPETELLLEWGLRALDGVANPLVVDLCTGSAALALAVAHARPDAEVHAVDSDRGALSWARRNLDAHGARVILHAGDVADRNVLGSYDGMVHLVLCNPPYVPDATPVPPEVTEHDPPIAVFAGPDGLGVIPHVVRTATRLLIEGGGLAIEHDESHAGDVVALLAERRVLIDVADHSDLAGRPRFATAHRRSARDPGESTVRSRLRPTPTE